MSKDSKQDRERLKEEYKEHYRKIREAKERLARSQQKKKITDALKNMDTSHVTDTFDEFLYKVKSKIANVEARLDVAMDSLAMSDEEFVTEEENDEELRRAKAKETLKQAKVEMGLLYNEIEQQADSLQVKKTIGTDSSSGTEGAEEDNKNMEEGRNK